MKTTEEIHDARSAAWHDDFMKNGFTKKQCRNCNRSGYEKGDTIISCGHHIQNFTPNSSCGSWASPTDKDMIEERNKRRKELKAKLGIE